MALYRRIYDLREDNDRTQQELADALEISKSTYIRYEKGMREIPLTLAVRLAQYYGVSLLYVAGLSDQK